jgi:hypothetical protein
MDTEFSERLPVLKQAVSVIKSGNSLSVEQISLLRQSLNSNDPVLVSIAAWCVREAGAKGDVLRSELDSVPTTVGPMAQAFVALAKEEKSMRGKPIQQKSERLRAMVSGANPYLKVESAKMLLRIDKSEGKAVLEQLTREKATAQEAIRTMRNVDKVEGAKPRLPVPVSDEKYALVLSIVE